MKIQAAKYAGNFKMPIAFDNGDERIIDFEPFLKNNRNIMEKDSKNFGNIYVYFKF